MYSRGGGCGAGGQADVERAASSSARRRSRRAPAAGGAWRGQGVGEALVVERLEQVVEGVDLEGAQGVAVVGGDEDHGRGRAAGGRSAASTSKPFISGICTSRKTRSGRSRRIAATASRPAPASPTTSTSGSLGAAGAALARQRLVVDDQACGCGRRSRHRRLEGDLAASTTRAAAAASSASVRRWRARVELLRAGRARCAARRRCASIALGRRPAPSSRIVDHQRAAVAAGGDVDPPGAARGAMPWRMAFSTSGCRMRLGTSASRRAGAMSRLTAAGPGSGLLDREVAADEVELLLERHDLLAALSRARRRSSLRPVIMRSEPWCPACAPGRRWRGGC